MIISKNTSLRPPNKYANISQSNKLIIDSSEHGIVEALTAAGLASQTSSNFGPLLGGGSGGVLSSVSNVLTQGIDYFTGLSLRFDVLNDVVYQGGSTKTYTFPLQFYVEDDPIMNVLAPIKRLDQMASPRRGNLGDSSLNPPGPRPGNRGDRIRVIQGDLLDLDEVAINLVAANFSTETVVDPRDSSKRLPQFVQINLGVILSGVYTAEKINRQFVPDLDIRFGDDRPRTADGGTPSRGGRRGPNTPSVAQVRAEQERRNREGVVERRPRAPVRGPRPNPTVIQTQSDRVNNARRRVGR